MYDDDHYSENLSLPMDIDNNESQFLNGYTTLSITTFTIMTFQHNDIQHNGTQHNYMGIMTLGIRAEHCYADCSL
jgi:hypothetical protein